MKKRRTKEEIQKLKDDGPPLCKCGCENFTKWCNVNKKYNKYLHNHHFNGKKHTKESLNKQSKSKLGKNNPMYGLFGKDHPNTGKKRTKEQNKRNSDIQLKRYEDPYERIKTSAAGQGISIEEWTGFYNRKGYCDIWLDEDYKKDIFERDNFTCQNEYCHHTADHWYLVRHHIEHDKQKCGPRDLITVCTSCNIRANNKKSKKFWIRYYKRRIKQIYGEI